MLKNMSLGKKLTGAFVVVAGIIAVVGGIGYRGSLSASGPQGEGTTLRLPEAQAIGQISMEMAAIQRSERTLLLPYLSRGAFAREKEKMSASWAAAEQGLKKYEALPRSGEGEALWKEFLSAWTVWKREHEAVVQSLGKGSAATREAFKQSVGPAEEAFRRAEGVIGKLGARNAGGGEGSVGTSAARTKLLLVFVSVFGVIAALGLGIFLSASISGTLNRATASLSDGATQVTSAAGQLSSSSQLLADGSSAQAASLEETASAMEEMSAMTRSNTESAGQAKNLSDRAGVSVDKANASMTQLVGQMAEISAMGEEIGKIIKTIDEIAFQTNLLALNAAVEAARAGEAGAGFAVVADEVRNLAQRAAGAAKNTSELIEGAIKRIKDGTALVEKTNADFSEVTVSVKKVTELASEVSAASSEQARGISEVSSAISQMDRVTQQNAASAEEIASASEEMNAQASSMQEIVRGLQRVVRGGNGDSAGAVFEPPPPPPPKDAGRRMPAVAKRRAALSPGAGGRKGGNGKDTGEAPRKPEEIIPLEEKSMEDF